MNMPPQNYGAGPGSHNPYAGGAPQMGAPAGYGAPGMGVPPQYEFTHEQNQVIAKVAGRAKGVGIINYITAVFDLIGTNFVGAAIAFAIGYQFHQGGSALQRVVDSQGNDITHLMEALDKLAGAFMIKLVLVIIAAVIFLLVGLIAGGAIVSAISQGQL